MKKLILFIMVFAIQSSLAYSLVESNYYDTTILVHSTYDETWNKLIQTMILKNVELNITNKESGLITCKIDLDNKIGKKYVNCTQDNYSNNYVDVVGNLNIIVRNDGDNVKIIIISSFDCSKITKGIGKDSPSKIFVKCKSSGLFEKEIFENIK